MTLAEIEQAKHAASWLNSLATNLVTTGAIAPVIAYIAGTPASGGGFELLLYLLPSRVRSAQDGKRHSGRDSCMSLTFLFVLAGPVLMGLLGIGVGLLALSKVRRSHRRDLAAAHLRDTASSKDAAE